MRTSRWRWGVPSPHSAPAQPPSIHQPSIQDTAFVTRPLLEPSQNTISQSTLDMFHFMTKFEMAIFERTFSLPAAPVLLLDVHISVSRVSHSSFIFPVAIFALDNQFCICKQSQVSVIKSTILYSGGSRGEDGRPLLVVGLFSQHLVSAGLGWAGLGWRTEHSS